MRNQAAVNSEDILNNVSGRSRKYPEIVGVSDSMRRIRKTIEQIGPTDLSVIIYGDNGTGKDLIAEALHCRSMRADGVFLKVNPLTICMDDSSHGEGEEDGEFPGGSIACDCDLLEMMRSVSEGTIFLDRMHEVSCSGQLVLMRFFRDFECRVNRCGKSGEMVPRFFASSNGSLTDLVQKGIFRADLFHRLNEISISLPLLRDRKEDIIPLSTYFLKQYARKYACQMPVLHRQTVELFLQYDWPGNVRELQNVIQRLVLVGNEKDVCVELESSINRRIPGGDFADQGYPIKEPGAGEGIPAETYQAGVEMSELSALDNDFGGLREINERVVEKVEIKAILKVLEYTHWHRKKAAKLLGVNYRTLLNKIRKYGLGRDFEA